MSSILCTLNIIDGNLLHLISRVMWCQVRWQQVERLLALADRARLGKEMRSVSATKKLLLRNVGLTKEKQKIITQMRVSSRISNLNTLTWPGSKVPISWTSVPFLGEIYVYPSRITFPVFSRISGPSHTPRIYVPACSKKNTSFSSKNLSNGLVWRVGVMNHTTIWFISV